MDKFRIVMTGPGKGEVYRNGERIERVVGVSFTARAMETNVVTLEFAASEIEIECEANG